MEVPGVTGSHTTWPVNNVTSDYHPSDIPNGEWDLIGNAEGYPRTYVGVLCSVLAVEALLGLASNIVVLLVYHLDRKSMQKVSNVLIINLSILDMVVCVTAIPLTIAILARGPWHDAMFCFVHEAFASFASTSTALNLLIISYDRYETVVVPFDRKLSFARAKFVLGIIWSLTLVAFLAPLLLLSTFEEDLLDIKDDQLCYRLLRNSESQVYAYFDIYCIVLYLTSNTVVIICYVRIFKAAQTRINVRMAVIKAAVVSLQGQGAQPEATALKSHERTMTKMTLMIVFTFMVCWGPQTLVSLLVIVREPNLTLHMIQLTCLTLAYSTPSLHPLLYAFMRKNFRLELGKQFRARLRSIRGPVGNSKEGHYAGPGPGLVPGHVAPKGKVVSVEVVDGNAEAEAEANSGGGSRTAERRNTLKPIFES